MNKITAHLIGTNITSNSREAVNLQSSTKFGDKQNDKVNYMILEALYLVEKNQMEILDLKDKKVPFKKLLKKLLKADKKLLLKYSVFKDLRGKRLIPKTGLKYGADFRVYKKKGGHSEWLCIVESEKDSIKWKDFAGKNRVAHSTKKKLLVAIVDGEEHVTYYEVEWKRL